MSMLARSVRSNPPRLLTVEDVARSLALGRTKTYELIASGRLRSVTIGRARRVPVAAVADFVASLEDAGAP